MKLTVIIPVYNREKTIKRAIVSVVEQLQENMECVVINDGSTDNTETVIQECVSNLDENIERTWFYRRC